MKHLSVHIPRYEIDSVLLLEETTFVVNAEDRIGIVGPNGAGKTTLMKIITGEISGQEISILNTGGMVLGYLSQIHFDREDRLVREDLRLAFGEILALEQELQNAEEHMDDEGGIERYTELLERFTMLGGYDFDREIDRVARGLGIFDLLDRSVKEVSG